MKVYSIGREAGCDIVINDNSDVISRRHAIINVTPSGKMTVVDQSQNGTYVNGIRISPNVPVPVTRKDNISFAHVTRLDWNMIPKSNARLRYTVIGIAVVLIVIGGILGFNALGGSGNSGKAVTEDSTMIKAKQAVQDSISKAQAKQDSISKVQTKKDSVRKTRHAEAKKASFGRNSAKTAKKKVRNEEKKPTKKASKTKGETKKVNNRLH